MKPDKRTHRRANKQAQEQEIRRMVRRSIELHRAQYRDAVYEELEKPVFAGYTRFFELRPDIARRNDASRWRAILLLVQNVEFSRRKDFKRRHWPSRRLIPHEHHLSSLSTWEMNRKVPARYHVHFEFFFDERGRRAYRFLYPWMMVSVRKKAYHTHRRVVDVELEREISYLDERMDQNRYWAKWSNRNHRSYSWDRHSSRNRIRDRIHAEEIREGLLDWHFREDIVSPFDMDDHA